MKVGQDKELFQELKRKGPTAIGLMPAGLRGKTLVIQQLLKSKQTGYEALKQKLRELRREVNCVMV